MEGNLKLRTQSFYNYVQLLYREVTGILLYQGSQDQFSFKHPERSKGCFVGNIGRENPWLSKIFNFLKK